MSTLAILIIAVWFVAVVVWIVWEYRTSPTAYETTEGYGPVNRAHSGLPLEAPEAEIFEWPARPAEDTSEVRHGGLGK